MPDRPRILALVLTVALFPALPGCARPDTPPAFSTPPPSAFTLAGEVIFRPKVDTAGLRLGGFSGMVSLRDGRELLAISDDSENPRVIRFRVSRATGWNVEPIESIRLETGQGAPVRLDPEGLALTSDGHLLISSEGLSVDGVRLPPSITEYSPDGRYIRQLPVPSRYLPNPTGPLVSGVRPNASFESLTTSPDFSRLFTATEIGLVQDAEDDPFAAAPRTRLLEYVQHSGGYHPAREFAYALDALPRPAFPVGFAVNGLVELLALNNSELLALERAFVEAKDKAVVINRIRIFRISLEGADDISAVEGLGDRAPVTPVKKILLADLGTLDGRSPALSNLDNFEGLAWGPPDDTGVRPLIVVSDDNFSSAQVTAFLFLRTGGALTSIR
ncbi:MAG TPA: esterase-like activity of phytase family protein [Vicinamibacterales bacterium]|nr:esterase-like activity of phytase family protein [Vicinamibacterales bacterium]